MKYGEIAFGVFIGATSGLITFIGLLSHFTDIPALIMRSNVFDVVVATMGAGAYGILMYAFGRVAYDIFITRRNDS